MRLEFKARDLCRGPEPMEGFRARVVWTGQAAAGAYDRSAGIDPGTLEAVLPAPGADETPHHAGGALYVEVYHRHPDDRRERLVGGTFVSGEEPPVPHFMHYSQKTPSAELMAVLVHWDDGDDERKAAARATNAHDLLRDSTPSQEGTLVVDRLGHGHRDCSVSMHAQIEATCKGTEALGPWCTLTHPMECTALMSLPGIAASLAGTRAQAAWALETANRAGPLVDAFLDACGYEPCAAAAGEDPEAAAAAAATEHAAVSLSVLANAMLARNKYEPDCQPAQCEGKGKGRKTKTKARDQWMDLMRRDRPWGMAYDCEDGAMLAARLVAGLCHDASRAHPRDGKHALVRRVQRAVDLGARPMLCIATLRDLGPGAGATYHAILSLFRTGKGGRLHAQPVESCGLFNTTGRPEAFRNVRPCPPPTHWIPPARHTLHVRDAQFPDRYGAYACLFPVLAHDAHGGPDFYVANGCVGVEEMAKSGVEAGRLTREELSAYHAERIAASDASIARSGLPPARFPTAPPSSLPTPWAGHTDDLGAAGKRVDVYVSFVEGEDADRFAAPWAGWTGRLHK